MTIYSSKGFSGIGGSGLSIAQDRKKSQIYRRKRTGLFYLPDYDRVIKKRRFAALAAEWRGNEESRDYCRQILPDRKGR